MPTAKQQKPNLYPPEVRRYFLTPEQKKRVFYFIECYSTRTVSQCIKSGFKAEDLSPLNASTLKDFHSTIILSTANGGNKAATGPFLRIFSKKKHSEQWGEATWGADRWWILDGQKLKGIVVKTGIKKIPHGGEKAWHYAKSECLVLHEIPGEALIGWKKFAKVDGEKDIEDLEEELVNREDDAMEEDTPGEGGPKRVVNEGDELGGVILSIEDEALEGDEHGRLVNDLSAGENDPTEEDDDALFVPAGPAVKASPSRKHSHEANEDTNTASSPEDLTDQEFDDQDFESEESDAGSVEQSVAKRAELAIKKDEVTISFIKEGNDKVAEDKVRKRSPRISPTNLVEDSDSDDSAALYTARQILYSRTRTVYKKALNGKTNKVQVAEYLVEWEPDKKGNSWKPEWKVTEDIGMYHIRDWENKKSAWKESGKTSRSPKNFDAIIFDEMRHNFGGKSTSHGYLIQWKDGSEPTWMKLAEVKKKYPVSFDKYKEKDKNWKKMLEDWAKGMDDALWSKRTGKAPLQPRKKRARTDFE